MKQVEVEQNVWCSWCFEQGTHYRIERQLLGRNTYRCALCCNDTKCCTLCSDGMSRCTTDGSDKLCMKCDGTIEQWGVYPPFVEQKGNCSWCFKETIHLLVKYNYVRRSIYFCSECKHRTLRCRSCDSSFARGYVTYDDEDCYACNNYIPNWKDPETNKRISCREAWCSWCVTESTHIVDQMNTVRRNIYYCSACDGKTLPCFTCKIGMARGGSGWDDDCCLGCSHKKNVVEKLGHGLFEFGKSKQKDEEGNAVELTEAWKEFLKKKEAVNSKYDDPNFVRQEMERESDFRKQAYDAGMIRPFLLLVGMTPHLRNQVACFLGWSTITEKYFGDSHAESWDILNRGGKGMISRANSITQKINPLAKNCTYYDLLHRVMESVFKLVPLPSLPYKDSYRASNLSDRPHSAGSGSGSAGSGSGPSNSDEGIAPGSVNEPIHLDTNTNTIVDAGTTTASGNDSSRAKAEVEQLQQKSESAEVSQMSTENTREDSKNTLLIAQLEEYMMAQVHAQQRKTMTRAQRINEDKLAENESSEFNEALELLKVKTGLSNKQALMYGVSVTKQVFAVPGKWGLTMMSMQALATALPSTAVFMGPAIAGLTVLLGPLAVVGLAQLVWTGVNLAIGPSLWCLYGPLVLMSNQRIVLALQDMQVEKFY